MLNKKYIPENFLKLGIYTILIFIPFHAFFTAWFASNFGYFDAIRIWKEVLLILTLPILSFLIFRNKKILRSFRQNKIVKISVAYLTLQFFMTLYGYISGNVSFQASVYGLIINTRFLVFMLICMVFAEVRKKLDMQKKLILIPAAIVIAFGLLQLILPPDFLRHFGYGPDTLVAYQTVDNKPDIIRLQSTLRGPNPLGAYLVVILLVIGANLKSNKRLLILVAPFLLFILYSTYSRSAWLGLLISFFAYLYLSRAKDRKTILATGIVTVIVGIFGVYVFRNNDTIQNALFHTNEKTTSSISSNEARLNSIKGSINTIKDSPIGYGVGSAGPASLRNTKKPSSINENYFLQVGVEAGVIGLFFFCALVFYIAKELWVRKSDNTNIILSILLGLVFVNFVSHAWADDTLAYVFFGLVGLSLGLKNSTKSEKKGVHLT